MGANESTEYKADDATSVTFVVNGKPVEVIPSQIPGTLSLARYLRDHLLLTGTKIMCNQAGCGTCVVTAVLPNGQTMSVNSCITPVLSCQGWDITTVEGLGNPKTGLNPIQSKMVECDASQCGFCTSGMIMQMNSHLEVNPNPKVKDIEDILDGNICRCTGYRPILDALKSFAHDTPKPNQKKANHADFVKIGDVACTSKRELRQCFKTKDCNWWVPQDVDDVLAILKNLPEEATYRLVAGNTGTGVYAHDGPYTDFIDVRELTELSQVTKTPDLVFGGNASLAQVINTMQQMAEDDPQNYSYGNQVVTHLKKVAHTSVRNTGTIAGNLLMKHAHQEFPSDIFLNLEALGAVIIIKEADGTTKDYLPSQWLQISMDRKVLYQVKLPKLDASEYTYCSYKITPRRVNAHAYANVATKIRTNSDFVVLETPSIVCGGISADIIHASATEAMLVSTSLKNPTTLKQAMDSLSEEIIPDSSIDWHAESDYRVHLVQACLYKSILKVLGDQVPKNLRSAAERELPRGISSGSQSYKINPDLWPMNKPIHKIEGPAQCSGTAEYVADIPAQPDELHGAFVYSTEAACFLDQVLPNDALAIDGVVSYLDHNDITGKNDITAFGARDPLIAFNEPEELFCSGKVRYAGQPVGIIVAKTREIALAAAERVKITYKNRTKPVVSMKDAMKNTNRVETKTSTQVGEKPSDIARTFSGEIDIGSQYHFYMETQSVLVRPRENSEFDVDASTQWMHLIQLSLSKVTGLPSNKFNIKMRRCGGAFGGKIKNSLLVACAATVAADKLNQPIKIHMDLQANMRMLGKREPYFATYQVGASDDGMLKEVNVQVYCDTGFTTSEQTAGLAVGFLQNVYNCPFWKIDTFAVKTDTASNTACRAPGATEVHNMMEIMMEHVADGLGMDPLEVKRKNFFKKGDQLVTGFDQVPVYLEEENPMPTMISNLVKNADIEARRAKITEFNKANKWIKRGMSVIPSKYQIGYPPVACHCQVSIFSTDGTIAVLHGGSEIGQGINTKVAQAVTRYLRAPSVDMVAVKAADANVSPNSTVTGGSFTSEMLCLSAMKACQAIRQKLDEVEKTLDNPDWKTLIETAYNKGVELCARYGANSLQDNTPPYYVWAAAVAEVEVDTLTGEKNVLRADIVEDTGASISQAVDIGQVEGAFVMGMGLWTSEKISFEASTGRLLTDDTWNYKPPSAYDIPQELNVTFIEGDKTKGMLGSKATGEPAMLSGVGVAMAIRDAVKEARKEVDPNLGWYNIVGPMTVEQIQKDSMVTASDFTL